MKNPTELLSTGSTALPVPHLIRAHTHISGEQRNPSNLSRVILSGCRGSYPGRALCKGIAEHDFPLINSGNYFRLGENGQLHKTRFVDAGTKVAAIGPRRNSILPRSSAPGIFCSKRPLLARRAEFNIPWAFGVE